MTITRELLDRKYIRRLIKQLIAALPAVYTKSEIDDQLDFIYGQIATHTHGEIDGGNA